MARHGFLCGNRRRGRLRLRRPPVVLESLEPRLLLAADLAATSLSITQVPAAGSGLDGYSLSVLQDAATGSISGRLFHDADADGVIDNGEAPLAGWTVFLDQDGSGVLDSGEPSTVTSAGIQGVDQGQSYFDYGYWFDQDTPRWQQFVPQMDRLTGIRVHIGRQGNPGDLIVAVRDAGDNTIWSGLVDQNTVPLGAGWLEVPADAQLTPGATYSLVLSSSAPSLSPSDRYFWSCASSSDLYPAGASSTDPYLPGSDFAFETYGWSVAPGTYSFTGLPIGSYRVAEVVPAGWAQSLPLRNANYTVNLVGDAATACDFGNYQPGIRNIELTRGIDYQTPLSTDDGYEYGFAAIGLGLTDIRLITPWGQTVKLSDLAPADWDGWTPFQVYRGAIDARAQSDGQGMRLSVAWQWLTDEQWASLSAATQAMVSYIGGSWSASLDFASVSQHTQDPAFLTPGNRDLVQDDLAVEWSPWTMAGDNGYIVVSLESMGEDPYGIGYSESAELPGGETLATFPTLSTSWGIYELGLSFVDSILSTVSGVTVQTAAYTESEYYLERGDYADDVANTPVTAAPLQVGSIADGQLDYEGDVDAFSFQALAGTTYNITAFTDALTAGTGINDAMLFLLAGDGRTVLSWDDDGGQAGLDSRIIWTAPADGTYYVLVDSYGLDYSNVGSYQIGIVSAIVAADAPQGTIATPAQYLAGDNGLAVGLREWPVQGAVAGGALIGQLFNLASPLQPAVAGSWAIGDSSGMAVDGTNGMLYVADSSNAWWGHYGLQGFSEIVAYDVSSGQPTEVYRQRFSHIEVNGTVLDNGYLYASTRDAGNCYLEIYNVTNPAGAVKIGEVEIPPVGLGYSLAATIAAEGARAYLVHENGALTIVDVSDPSAPTVLSQYSSMPWGGMEINGPSLKVNGGILWGGAGWNLYAVDVSDAANPTLLATLSFEGEVVQFQFVNSMLYVGIDGMGAAAVDTTDPANPVIAKVFTVIGAAGGVGVEGTALYVPADAGEIQIFDLSGSSGNGMIKGEVFDDINANGVRDGGEGTLTNWTVYLDINHSGAYESDVDVGVQTDANGRYTLTGLGAGTYRLSQVVANGYVPSSLPDVPEANGSYYSIVQDGHGAITGFDFGNYRPGAIYGQLWDDLDLDGALDTGESSLRAWTVYLDLDNSGSLTDGDLVSVTDSSGQYSFPNLAPGDYRVRESLPVGWQQSRPLLVAHPSADNYSVSLGSNEERVLDFANYQLSQIHGALWNDINANYSQDAEEDSLPGWTIYLDLDNSGSLTDGDTTVVTDSSGSYTFSGLTPGSYRVRSVIQTGWRQSVPTDDYSITLLGGEDRDLAFAAYQPGVVQDVEVHRGIDYATPLSSDDAFVYTVEATVFRVSDVQLTTPWRESVSLSSFLPDNWDGASRFSIRHGALEVSASQAETGMKFTFDWRWLSSAQWASLDTTPSSLLVTYFGGSWSGDVDFTRVTQPTVEPEIYVPYHRQQTSLNVVAEWEAWTTAQTGSIVYVEYGLEYPGWQASSTTSGSAELPASATYWVTGALTVSGTYHLSVSFVDGDDATVNGVSVRTVGYTTGVSYFAAGSSGDDYGNAPSEAAAAAANASSPISGNLDYVGDVDMFHFQASAGVTYEIVLTAGAGGTGDSMLLLASSDGRTVLSYDNDSGQARTSRILWTAKESGTYYVAVDSREFDEWDIGSYELKIAASQATSDLPDAVYNNPAQYLLGDGLYLGFQEWPEQGAISGNDDGMLAYIYDLSHPENPVTTASWYIGDVCGVAVDADNHRFYIADGSNSAWVWDPGQGHDVLQGFSELLAYDVVGGRPVEAYRQRLAHTDANWVALSNGRLYAVTRDNSFTSYLEVYNLLNPSQAVKIGELAISNPDYNDTNVIALDGATAYIFQENGALSIANVANPAAPSLLAQYVNTPWAPYETSGPLAVQIRNGVLWAAANWNLYAMDVSNPQNIQLLAAMPMDGQIGQLQLIGNKLYVGLDGIGVKVLDISNASIPRQIAKYNAVGATGSLGVASGYLYLATDAGQTMIFDLTNAAPTAGNLDINVAQGRPISVALPGSDSETPNSLQYIVTVAPARGTVTISGHTALYTPAANWFGSDSFQYVVRDSGQRVNPGLDVQTSAPGTVSITVSPAALYSSGNVTVIGLGALGDTHSEGYAINSVGQVAGSSFTTTDQWHSFYWSDRNHDGAATANEMLDLGSLRPSEDSWPWAINAAGWVVGVSYVGSAYHAYIDIGNGMEDMGTLGGPHSNALDINSSGYVIGMSYLANGRYHAFLDTGGGMTDIGTAIGGNNVAHGINDFGEIVGWWSSALNATPGLETTGVNPADCYGFLYVDGTVSAIASLGGRGTYPTDINNYKQVAGYSQTTGGQDHAFLWQDGGLKDLGTLGGSASWAWRLNNVGQIVGWSYTASGLLHAFLWDPSSGMIDLNNLLPAGSGWVLERAYDINDAGQIVGYGVYQGKNQAFVLTPGGVLAPATRADLNNGSVNYTPDVYYPGGTLPATALLSNVGAANAGSFNFEVRLSKDRFWGNADDIALSKDTIYSGLARGASIQGNYTFDIPETAAAGSYYLVALIDSDNSVAESNEVDNWLWSASADVQVVSINPFFDAAYYSAAYADVGAAIVANTVANAYQHFVRVGVADGRDPNDLFSESQYLAANPDVAAAISDGSFQSGFEHYLLYGGHEGRSPSQGFDERYYLANNPDVAAAVAAGSLRCGFEHYVLFGRAEGRQAVDDTVRILAGEVQAATGTSTGEGRPFSAGDLEGIFDEAYYLATYADVRSAVEGGAFASGLDHFLRFGASEGRSPSSDFDEQAYLARYADVREAVQAGAFRSGLEHYLLYGRLEGRAGMAHFDEQTYLLLHADVRAAVQAGAFASGYQHYLQYGRAEGRTAWVEFDEQAYLAANADVAQAVAEGLFASGLEHYLLFGQHEGRAA